MNNQENKTDLKYIDIKSFMKRIKKQNEIKAGEKIIRYMNFAKLISLLETKELFLTPADKFEDSYEGLFPNNYISFHKNKGKKKELVINPQTIHDEIEFSKRKTYINSWNILENESYALWKIYGEGHGVAIQSNFKELENLVKDKNAVIRKVNYLNDEDTYFHVSPDNQPISIVDFFSIKKKYYNYEEELRVILLDEPDKINTIPINDIENFITKVYVSPFAEDWFVDLVKKVVQDTYSLNIDVIRSEIWVK